MFAGAATVDLGSIVSAGFSTRIEARRALFQRVRLLYEVDYEIDCKINVIQSLLLMTLCREVDSAQKDPCFWMNACVSYAQSIGLHRDCSQLSPPPSDLRLRRRLWWGIHVRDKLMALELDSRVCIRDDECDIAPLTLADFDVDVTCSEYLNSMPLHSKDDRQTKAIMFIELTKLCRLVGGVLSTFVYNFTERKYSIEQSMPGESSARLLLVHFYDNELQVWLGALPTQAQYVPYSPEPEPVSETSKTILLYSAFLKIIYLFLLLKLQHHQAFPPRNWMSASHFDSIQAQQVYLAATEITDIMWSLYNASLAPYLPTTGVDILSNVARTHILGAKSDDFGLRSRWPRQFRQCVHILRSLRNSHGSAKSALAILHQSTPTAVIDLTLAPLKNSISTLSPRSTCIQTPTLMKPLAQVHCPSKPADLIDSFALYAPEADSIHQNLSADASVPQNLSNASIIDKFLYSRSLTQPIQGILPGPYGMSSVSKSCDPQEIDTNLSEDVTNEFLDEFLELDDTLAVCDDNPLPKRCSPT
ncbi:uncharacterized protein N7484_005326 [Penicillium longicatenatum]|uniref:uncharacterized protein n=1 Tax=Penicillium longicatenatum TaxID=1561947 RepID=UPI0025482A62|nr:uncharacterized protein N7484_005326 [Penicillium longicatenatum]KAJ5651603.1 hypothetical protein N7484_005326 [Penicillium longicatenatum]